MVSTKQYSLDEIQIIKQNMSEFNVLSSVILQKIKELYNISQVDAEVDISDKNHTHISRKFIEKNNVRDNNERRSNNKSFVERKRNTNGFEIENWNVGKTFKATPKIVKEGADKIITEIRLTLNKFTNKNYDTQCNIITQLIQQIIDIDVESTEEQTYKISKIIFDIASSNKVLSVLYAKLYKHLINAFYGFKTNITDLLKNYTQSFDEIYYVDPNKDYDGYCRYTKTNDTRKAMTFFIINLMCNDVLDEKSILETILYLEDMILKYAEDLSRTNEVEEITENLFILITQSISVLKNTEEWKEKIIPTIHHLSKLKKENTQKYPSMSNRATFKYMDILDSLN
jgi:hypothetical protein